MKKAVYLVTTKYNSKLFEAKNNKYCSDNTFFREIILLEGGFFRSLWSFMFINDKLNFEIPLVKYVKGRLEKKTNFEKILEWWSYPRSENETMNEIADIALGLISNLSESDRNIYKRLLTGFIRIELSDVILLITHNWYNSGIFSFLRCDDNTKFVFVENLIKIAAKIEGIATTEIKLFLHDKDIIEHGDKDEPLKDCRISDKCISRCPNLCNVIKKGNVRTFIHDSHRVQPSFFKNVLNQGEPICKSVLEGYFNDRIPPKIFIIPKRYILIDISKADDKEKYSCSTTEIINAIVEFQLKNEFKLNAVEQSDEYEDALRNIQGKGSLPILVKGDRCLKDLQSEDGRALYLDSSVWIRYAQSEGAVQNIKIFFAECHKGIYKTANAQEMQEFRARLAKNSFLRSFVGGHYGDVIPFVFHSETEMNGLIYSDRINANEGKIGGSSLKAKLKYSKKTKGAKLHWRLLIVDDNAYQDSDLDERKVQKCKVVANVLKDDFYLMCGDSESDSPKCIHCKNMIKELNEKSTKSEQCFTVSLECVTNIEEAVAKLMEKRFDLILLDYLLGENKGKSSRNYGTSLLRDLKRQYEDNILIKNGLSEEDAANLKKYIQAKGPFGKLWIFFISAFSNAISERMLSEGIHYNTDYWYIARGACPTTTPELFRYNLYSLFYQQIKSITDASVVKVGNDDGSKVDSGVITLLDLLDHIFKVAVSIRDRAMKNFNSLLRLRAHYDILKHDYYMGGKDNPDAEKNGSPLVQALFPDLKYYSNAFWEHIQHLIYLIAFGNIRQWNEMWDEYIFIKDILHKVEVEDNRKEEDGVVRKIEKYIIGIKNANHR